MSASTSSTFLPALLLALAAAQGQTNPSLNMQDLGASGSKFETTAATTVRAKVSTKGQLLTLNKCDSTSSTTQSTMNKLCG